MKRAMMALVILFSGLFCGCSAHELEDRCFPMLALVDYEEQQGQVAFCDTFPTPRQTEDEGTATEEVDTAFAYGDTFAEALETYESRLSREADYNHLKVLVIGEMFLEKQEYFSEMLDIFWDSENFPRNAYVCVISDTRELLEIEDTLSDDAGTYLEQLLEKQEKALGGKLVTVGDLMDEAENQRESLELPYIAVEDGTVVWENDYPVFE